jgi:hypothetical protein
VRRRCSRTPHAAFQLGHRGSPEVTSQRTTVEIFTPKNQPCFDPLMGSDRRRHDHSHARKSVSAIAWRFAISSSMFAGRSTLRTNTATASSSDVELANSGNSVASRTTRLMLVSGSCSD